MTRFVFTGAVLESWHALDEFIKQDMAPALICTLKREFAYRHSDWADLRPLASEHGIPVLDFDNMNEPHIVEQVRQVAPDYIFVIGWSQLLKDDLLSIPKIGCVGFHPTALPKGRGRAAIPWTILNQQPETGVTMMYLDDGVDSGDIVAQVKFPVAPDEVAQTLYDKACDGLRQMIRQIVPYMKAGQRIPGTPQDHSQATYLAKRVPSDGWIDWEKPAEDIERLIRAVGKPYPGAFTVHKDKKLIIWEARLVKNYNQIGTIGQLLAIHDDEVVVQCGTDWLGIRLVQEEDGDPVPAARYFQRVHVKLGLNLYQIWQALRRLETERQVGSMG